MKFLAVFAAVLAVSCAYAPIGSWSIEEVSAAINDPATDPDILPALIAGLDNLMENVFAGVHQDTVFVSMPVKERVTLEQLTNALHDPKTNPAYMPYIESALDELMFALHSGIDVDSVLLNIPAMPVSIWSLEQLSDALSNPKLDSELQIYLEYALNTLMAQIFAGEHVVQIAVITPPGVVTTVPALPAVIPEIVGPAQPIAPPKPEPVKPEPVMPEPVMPVVQPPTPVVQPPAPVSNQSPLVQLIVNVNAQQQAPVNPAPVAVGPAVNPQEPTPIDQDFIAVGPWGPVNPAPVGGIEEPIIAVGPWGPANPAPAGGIEEPITAVGPWGPVNPAPAGGIEEPIIAVGPWVVPALGQPRH